VAHRGVRAVVVNWFRVDDGFHSHPKVAVISDAAAGLWVKAASWCVDYGTAGHVPARAVRPLIASRRWTPLVQELCTSRLWDVDPGGDGYRFHDWDAYQPYFEARRRAHAEAQRAYRQRVSASAAPGSDDHGDDHDDDHRDDHVTVTGESRDDHVTASRADARARPRPIAASVSSSVAASSAREPATDDDDDHSERVNGFVPAAAQQAAAVLAQVHELTGVVLAPAAAEAVRDDIVGDRPGVRDAAGYIRSAIAAEHRRDPSLTRWLAPARRGTPSPRPAAGVLAEAAEGRPEADPSTAHRGAEQARALLAARVPPPAEAPPPVRSAPTPAELRAARLAAEPDDDDPPPDPGPPDWPPPDPGDVPAAGDTEIPF
jgi:hypothetical protein